MLIKDILAQYKVKAHYIPIALLEPTEWDSWSVAITELGIKKDFRVSPYPVACEYDPFENGDGNIEVMDGHHRVSSALLRNETTVYGFVLPRQWSKKRRNKFWDDYNNNTD